MILLASRFARGLFGFILLNLGPGRSPIRLFLCRLDLARRAWKASARQIGDGPRSLLDSA
jgi:hypothetical protein